MDSGRELRLRIRGIQYPPREAGENGIQSREDIPAPACAGTPAVTVQEVEAAYFYKNDAHYLFYEERPEGCDRVLKTRVKRRGRLLEIHRQGPYGNSMVFEPGKSRRTEYATPFGTLTLDVVTRSVEFVASAGAESGAADATAGNGQAWQDVKILYALEHQGESLGEYELYMERI